MWYLNYKLFHIITFKDNYTFLKWGSRVGSKTIHVIAVTNVVRQMTTMTGWESSALYKLVCCLSTWTTDISSENNTFIYKMICSTFIIIWKYNIILYNIQPLLYHSLQHSYKRDWDSWAHKPSLSHLSLVCSLGHIVNILSNSLVACWLFSFMCFLNILLHVYNITFNGTLYYTVN